MSNETLEQSVAIKKREVALLKELAELETQERRLRLTVHAGRSKHPVSIELVKLAVCNVFNVNIADMEAPSGTTGAKADSIAWPRQVAMTLAYELTAASLNEVGDSFGGRDHGTVIHARTNVAARCKLYKSDNRLVERARQSAKESMNKGTI